MNSAPIPGWATITRSRGKPSVAATSSAVNAELAKITSHVSRRVRVLVRVHRARAGRSPTRESAAARGRGSSSRARRLRCGGYIQSVKWSTSNGPSQRSAGGQPRRDQAVRQPCAPMNVFSRSSTGMPASTSGITRRPSGEVGANATTSSPARAPRPRRAPGASRGCSCSRPPARATAARRRRRSSRLVVEREEVGTERRASPWPGTAVRSTSKRTEHRPFAAESRARGASPALGGDARAPTTDPPRGRTVCTTGCEERGVASQLDGETAALAADSLVADGAPDHVSFGYRPVTCVRTTIGPSTR